MATYSASVENGKVDQYVSDVAQKKSTLGTDALGKDAFLQLLCTQMQYQDPLNPSSDTDFIAQLASFSSLEQMQNLNSTFTQAQAFSMIGKEVRVTADNSDGYVQGTIDYVTVSNGKTYFSISDKLYEADDLITVIDEDFLAQQKAPYILQQNVSYDHDNPSDVSVKVNLGEDDGAASSFAVVINGTVVDSDNLSYDETTGTVTISKEAFEDLDAGTYKIMFGFDDKLETSVTDKVTVTVKGTKSAASADTAEESSGSEESSAE